MSLDSNTTELNEILDMAKNLPEAGGGEGGEAVQEVYYAEAIIDYTDAGPSVVMLSSVDELFAVVAETPLKHIALTVSFGEMRMIVPMSAFSLEGGVIAFDNAGKVGGTDMPVSVEVYADGTINSYLGGGDAPQTGEPEIAYVDAVFDFAGLSLVSVASTYDEIAAMIEAGKYVVLRATYAMISSPINIFYLPINTWTKEQSLLLFAGMTQARLNGNLVVLHLTGEMFASGTIETNVRVVSVTDLN